MPTFNSPIKFLYTNYRGETSVRTVEPVIMYFGKTTWHPERQWLLVGMDLRENGEYEERHFALKDCDFTRTTLAA